MEEPMPETKMQKQPKSTDAPPKTSKKKDIELTEKELDKVSGGQPCAGGVHIKDGVITT
jgi:bacteriocin-like protein